MVVMEEVGGAAAVGTVDSLTLPGDWSPSVRFEEWAELKLGDSPVSPDLVDLLSWSPSPPSPPLVVSLSSGSVSFPWQPRQLCPVKILVQVPHP